MKVSAKTRYAFRFCLHLTKNYGQRLVQIREVAEAEDISVKYLEQIAHQLKLASILTVERGSKGGYRLRRSPDEIKAIEIFNAVEGFTDLMECVSDGDICPRNEACNMTHFWNGFFKHMENYLDEYSLKDVVEGKFCFY